MKKTISILILLLLIPMLCFAGVLQEKQMSVIAKKNTVGGTSCNAANDYIGDKSVEANTTNMSQNYGYCQLFAAVCGGTTNCTLKTGYLYATTNQSATATLCVYSAAETASPDSDSNTKLSCVQGLADPAEAGWASGAMDTATAVTNGTNYWLCAFSTDANWSTTTASDSISWYHSNTINGGSCASSACADSPPTDLSGTWTEVTNKRRSAYVTVGP